MKSVLEIVLRDIAKNKGYHIHAIKILEDHLHLFVSKPNQTISDMFRNFKGISARIIVSAVS